VRRFGGRSARGIETGSHPHVFRELSFREALYPSIAFGLGGTGTEESCRRNMLKPHSKQNECCV